MCSWMSVEEGRGSKGQEICIQAELGHGLMITSVVSFTVKVFCMGELLKRDAANVWTGFGDSTGTFIKSQF